MFYQAFQNCASQYPEKTAIVIKDIEISYRKLDSLICNFAETLVANGVRPGTAVLIALPNSPEFVVAAFATFAIGGIVVPINNKFPADEIAYYIESSGAKFIVYSSASAPAAVTESTCVRLPISLDELMSGSHETQRDLIDCQLSSSSPAIYMYSSGSTGKPKRVTRTHAQLLAEAKSMAATIELTSDDRILCTVPMYHAHGLGNCVMATLLNGGTLVIGQGEFNARDTMRLLEQQRITIYPAVPFMFKMLAEAFIKIQPEWPNLRLLFSAGAPLPSEVAEKFNDKFHHPIKQLYGSTETGAVAIDYLGSAATTGSVGKPLRSVLIEVLDEQQAPLGQGNTGEIAIKTAAMTRQYDGLPEASAECFIDDYFLPGDLGYLDPEGNVYITGRKKLMINVAGYKVDPLDVESVIRTYPKVSDVVVLAQADPNYGEMVKAVVVANGECSEDEIISHCAQHLIDYKVPKLVLFRSEIPRSPLGKILRKYL